MHKDDRVRLRHMQDAAREAVGFAGDKQRADPLKRRLKRLAWRYRHIRADVEPVIQSLEAGETPGDNR